jgi:hypothetical protein
MTVGLCDSNTVKYFSPDNQNNFSKNGVGVGVSKEYDVLSNPPIHTRTNTGYEPNRTDERH